MGDSTDESLVLGIDLGTSAVKVVVLAADARKIASGSASFDTICDLPDQAEQNPADWVAALERAAAAVGRELGQGYPSWHDRVAAVGVTGQLPTLVCSGSSGPLGPAITWKDARADHTASATLGVAGRRALYQRTGMPIDGRYLGPMFQHHWLAQRSRVQSILSAKDYLVFVLTGQRLTDPSTAAGYGTFDLAKGSFCETLCELWDMPYEALPAVCSAHSIAGPLTQFGARILGVRPGIPVTVGAADSVSSAFAMAGLEEGIACVIMGSGTVIIDAIRERRLDPDIRYLLTPHVESGWYGREMDLLATGTGYRWLSDLLGWSEGQLDQHAAGSAAGAHGLTFAPHLAGGEQGALWDPARRGSILGLTLHHTASDIARAFLEGVGFEIRRCIEVLAQTSALRGVVIAGHLTEHSSSLRMLADILGRTVQPYTAVSPAAIGAALGALQLESPSPSTKLVDLPAVPAGADASAYEQLYSDYLARTR
jgi:xylulokinase